MTVIEGEIVEEPMLPAPIESSSAIEEWTPKFVLSVDEMVALDAQKQEFLKRVMRKDVHYGIIPGTGSAGKSTLLKPGAEALLRALGLHPEYSSTERILDFTGKDHDGEVFIYFERKCDLYAIRPDGRMWVGSGSAICTSWEDKYRWRQAQRTCPSCQKEAIIKGKAEYGGGWLCWKKKDGCGAKFADNDEKITSQGGGKVANAEVVGLSNTILKMADKRALIAVVLNVTGVSDVYTQDIHDPSERDPRDDEQSRPASTVTAAPAPGRSPEARVPANEQKLIADTREAFMVQLETGGRAALDAMKAAMTKHGIANSTALWAMDPYSHAFLEIVGTIGLRRANPNGGPLTPKSAAPVTVAGAAKPPPPNAPAPSSAGVSPEPGIDEDTKAFLGGLATKATVEQKKAVGEYMKAHGGFKGWPDFYARGTNKQAGEVATILGKVD